MGDRAEETEPRETHEQTQMASHRSNMAAKNMDTDSQIGIPLNQRSTLPNQRFHPPRQERRMSTPERFRIHLT